MKQKNLLVIMGAVVAALAVGLAVLLLNPPKADDGGLVIYDTAPSNIQTIEVENGFGRYTVRAEGEGYHVHDIPAELVDHDTFMLLMNSSSNVKAKQLVEEKPDDLALYGLDAPMARVKVTYKQGKSLELALGKVETVGGGVYFQAGGGGAVYLMDTYKALSFTSAAANYISRNVTEPLALSSPLSAVLDASFIGGGLQAPVVVQSVSAGGEVLAREALSYGAVTHLVRLGDDTFELDQTYGIEVLGSLLGIRAKTVEAYNCSPEQVAAYGFGTPWLQAEFDLMNNMDGEVYRLLLSVVPIEDGEYLIRRNEEDIIYRVPQQAFMQIDPGKMMMRWYMTPLIMDLSGVTVTGGGQTLDFEISGETNAEKQASLNGAPMDMALYRKFHRLLTSASNDGERLEAPQVAGQPLLVIEYRYNDPEKAPDRVEFYPGEVRKVTVVVNGNPIEYGMREMFVTRALEACKAVLAGEDFEENW